MLAAPLASFADQRNTVIDISNEVCRRALDLVRVCFKSNDPPSVRF